MRWRGPARSGTPPGDPDYSAPGAIDAALGAAVSRYQPSEDLDEADVAREAGVAMRILIRLRVAFVAVSAPAFLVGGIGAACHAPTALWVTGMLVCATSATGSGFAALLASRQPLRQLPRLRMTATVCCLFGSIPAVIFLGSGLASSTTTAGGRLTPAVGLAFLPATLMGLGGMVLQYLNRRMNPYVRAMRGGNR
jgi:hypothetical protein